MTKKDFELIAATIKEAHGNCSLHGQLGIAVVALHLAKALRTANPRFAEVRFVEACGVKDTLQLLHASAGAA